VYSTVSWWCCRRSGVYVIASQSKSPLTSTTVLYSVVHRNIVTVYSVHWTSELFSCDSWDRGRRFEFCGVASADRCCHHHSLVLYSCPSFNIALAVSQRGRRTPSRVVVRKYNIVNNNSINNWKIVDNTY